MFMPGNRKVTPIKASSSTSDGRGHSAMSHHEFGRNLDDELQDFQDDMHGHRNPTPVGDMQYETTGDYDLDEAEERGGEEEEKVQLAHEMPAASKKQYVSPPSNQCCRKHTNSPGSK
jgi:hypothetical protein